LANNVFKIKRTSVTGRAANTSTLTNPGELALNITDGIMFSTNGSSVFEIGANLTSSHITNSLTLDNDKRIYFKTLNASACTFFVNQIDDNFVLYTTNTSHQPRPVYSIYVNSNISTLNFLVPTRFDANVTVFTANGSVGSAGQVLTSNGSSVYWSSSGGTGTVTQINTGNGLSGGPITGTGTISVVANDGIISNNSGVFVKAGTGIVVNATGVHVTAVGVNTDAQYVWTNTHTFNQTINGTANNANYLGGNSASDLRTYSDNKAANAYSNVVSYTDTVIGNVNTAITSNASAAYTNAVSYVDNKFYVNTSQLSSNLSNYVTTTNLSNNLANYQTTAGLAANVATLASNSATYLGNSSGTIANVDSWITTNAAAAYTNSVSYTDGKILTANSAITGNAATAYTNAVSYTDSKILTANSAITGNAATAYTNAVAYTDGVVLNVNSAITSNASAAYTNAVSYTDGKILTANGAITGNAATAYTNAVSYTDGKILTANSAITGNAATAYTNAVSYTDSKILTANSAITGNAATAYTNATIFASNASNINTGTISEARLPFRMDQNVSTTNNVIFAGLTVTGNLVVNGTSTVLQGNVVTFTDNMLYLNQGISANITNITSNGTHVTFTANNNYSAGWDVSVSGVNPSSYNGNYNNIFAANNTTFTVANTNTNSYVSGGVARGKSDANPDIGIAAGYNDGTYYHTGIFRDASDGFWKVFDSYLPEPDESVFIDTTNTSFRIANFQANVIHIGNTSVYATVNTTNFTGTANNTLFVGSVSAANIVSNAQLSGNLSNYVTTTNLTNNLANYQTTAGLSANVATLSSNNSSFLGGTAAASYQLNSTLNANIASYLPTYTGTVNGAIFSVGTAFTANSTVTNTVSLIVSTNTATIGTGTYFVSNGNVGIGTASPVTRLHVVQNSDGEIFRVQRGGGSNLPILRVNITESTGVCEIEQTGATAGPIAFKTAAAERVRIDTAGNLGIGNSAPAYKLHVTGSASLGNTRIDSAASGATVGFWSGAGYFGGIGTVAGLTGSGSSTDIGIVADSGRALRFYANTATNEVMTIAANTNVGIGNTAPTHKLSVNGTTYIGGAVSSAINLTANTLGIYHTGTVNAASHIVGSSFIANATGVYTTGIVNAVSYGSFLGKFANGSTGTTIRLITNGAAQGEVSSVSLWSTFTSTADNGPRRTADITAGYSGGAWGNEYLSFNVGTGTQNDNANTTTERLRIIGSGNVGIGNAAPSDKLSVNGTGYFGANLTIDATADLVLPAGAGISANGGLGSAGQVLTSNATAVYWANVSNASASMIRQAYTGNGSTTVFTVTGGYTANELDVYLNGVKLSNGTDVTVTSGTTFTITPAPMNGSTIYAVGYRATTITALDAVLKAGDTMTGNLVVGNTTIGLNSITVGNSSVNTTVNSTIFTGTANNTLFVGSISAANVVSNAQLQANLSSKASTGKAIAMAIVFGG